MKTYILFVVALISLAGCGKDPEIRNVPGPTVTVTPAPDTSEAAQISAVVAEENAYRNGLGQAPITAGLSCTLYTITGGQYIQNDATHTPTLTGVSQVATFLFSGTFNQPDSPAD